VGRPRRRRLPPLRPDSSRHYQSLGLPPDHTDAVEEAEAFYRNYLA
jgi:hypothetical protein